MSDLTPVRDEDAFDVTAVHNWLSKFINKEQLPAVKQFRSGSSNLTYLLQYPNRELVLRRPPVGTKAVSAHDMKREFLIQFRLKPVYELVPTVIALCGECNCACARALLCLDSRSHRAWQRNGQYDRAHIG